MAPLAYLLCSQDDVSHVTPFLRHVRSLLKKGVLEIFHPSQLLASEPRARAADQARAAAWLLVFFSPALCPEDDPAWPVLQQRLRQRELRVIPILLRPLRFEDSEWADFQPTPRSRVPVSRWADPDDAWSTVATEVSEALGAAPRPAPLQQWVVQSIGVLLDRKHHWEAFTRHCSPGRHTLTVVSGPPDHGLPFFVERIRRHLPEHDESLLVELRDEWEGLPARTADEWGNALRRSLVERLGSSGGTLPQLLADATHHCALLLLLWRKPLEAHHLDDARRAGLRQLITQALPAALEQARPRHALRAVLPAHADTATDLLLAWARSCLSPAAPLVAAEIAVEAMPSWTEVHDSIAERRPGLDPALWREIEAFYQALVNQPQPSFAALVARLDRYL